MMSLVFPRSMMLCGGEMSFRPPRGNSHRLPRLPRSAGSCMILLYDRSSEVREVISHTLAGTVSIRLWWRVSRVNRGVTSRRML